MGKFSKPADDLPTFRPEPVCQSCGWHFSRDNAALRTHGKMTRTEPRTQITMHRNGMPIIRCSDCFERELFSTKAHTKSGTDGEGLYRQGMGS
jgi:transposase-like protein